MVRKKITDLTKGRLLGAGLPFFPGMDIPPLAKRVYAKIPAKPGVKKGMAQVLPFSSPIALGFNAFQVGVIGYGAYQEGWRVGQKRVDIPGGSNFVRVPRIYKKSNRVSGRKNGLGGPVQDPKATNRFARRRRKVIPRTGRKCPNGYRYDPKRKMCVYKGL